MRAARVSTLLAVIGLTIQIAAPVRAETIAVAPLETVAEQSKALRNLHARITRALATVPGFDVVADRKVRRALRRQPALRACDGDAGCLAELGRSVDARYVAYGEVGGLGAVTIVYLKVIDVAQRKEVRSTTVDLGGGEEAQRARAAAFRLLAPERYQGRLAVDVDVQGASIYVDGKRVARSPTQPISLAVGTHALRVTHPEFRDFVRFVDVTFGEQATVAVGLQQYPVVATDIQRDPETGQIIDPGAVGQEPTPWYRRWYGVAGLGAAAFVVSAVVVGVIAGGIDADKEIEIE